MLSREVMGALALAILWVNTLLIAASAAKAGAALARIGRALGAIAKGKVVSGEGPSSALGMLEIEQVGRVGSGSDAVILFHDRSHACKVFGGRVGLEGGGDIDLMATEDADVWVDAAEAAASAGSAPEAAFDVACAEARKARGYPRSLRALIVPGDPVWIATLPAPASNGGADGGHGSATLVSTVEPRAWIAKRVSVAYAFVVAEISVAAACTAAALQTPHFGSVSTAGAATAFVFFLLVQPAGTLVRDALTPPSRALRHDTWTRAGARSAGRRLTLGPRTGEPPRST